MDAARVVAVAGGEWGRRENVGEVGANIVQAIMGGAFVGLSAGIAEASHTGREARAGEGAAFVCGIFVVGDNGTAAGAYVCIFDDAGLAAAIAFGVAADAVNAVIALAFVGGITGITIFESGMADV